MEFKESVKVASENRAKLKVHSMIHILMSVVVLSLVIGNIMMFTHIHQTINQVNIHLLVL